VGRGDHRGALACLDDLLQRLAAVRPLEHAANVLPVIREIRRAGASSLHQIADALNARGITTPRGGQWHASSVRNVLKRA